MIYPNKESLLLIVDISIIGSFYILFINLGKSLYIAMKIYLTFHVDIDLLCGYVIILRKGRSSSNDY